MTFIKDGMTLMELFLFIGNLTQNLKNLDNPWIEKEKDRWI